MPTTTPVPSSPRIERPSDVRRRERLLSALLVLLTLIVFNQVVTFEFVNIDDQVYVTENPIVQQGLNLETIAWAFTSTDYAAFWQPLVWLSLMLDVELFGPWAGGFHLTNVLLHLANTIILFVWLSRLSGALWRAFFVAAFFAVHPLHVESVAWVTERKDVLSTFFGLIALLTWLRYVRTSDRWSYAATWLAMAASLMSKQMLVTLPFLFLLLDYWPLRRISKGPDHHAGNAIHRPWAALVIEKLPFFALSAIFCIVAYLAQSKGGATETLAGLSLSDRLGNAVIVYATYLKKAFWPSNLAVFYPHPGNSLPATAVISSAGLLVGVTIAVFLQRAKRPYLLVGWLWYLGTLVPVIGIVQIGYHQMADRFTYVPLIGIFLAVIWLVSSQKQRSNLLASVAAICLLACMTLSWLQTRHWNNSITLCQHGLDVTQDNWYLHSAMGLAVMRKPDSPDILLLPNQSPLELAEYHLRTAIRIQPDYATAHHNLGLMLSDYGQLAQANDCFRRASALVADNKENEAAGAAALLRKALEVNPDNANLRVVLANVLARDGKTEEAKTHLFKILEDHPDHAEARYGLADILARENKTEEAKAHLFKILEADPDHGEAHYGLALLFHKEMRLEQAADHCRRALHAKPDHYGAHQSLGLILLDSGKLDESVEPLLEALRLKPKNPFAGYICGHVFHRQNKPEEAATYYRRAVESDPEYVPALLGLASIHIIDRPELYDVDQAVALAKKACDVTGHKDPAAMEILAGVYVAAGRLDDAVITARNALEVARRAGDQDLVDRLRENLELYERARRGR